MSTKTVTINSNLSYTITYSVSNSLPTVTEVNFTKIQIVSPKGLSHSYELYFYLKDTGNYIQVAHGDVDAGTSGWTGTFSRTFQCSKAHSSSTAKIYFKLAMYSFDDDSQHIDSGNISITVPAKTSYKITFNANNGSGGPSSQTKWHGENLTLTTSKPTRTGYTFSKWNTKSDGSGTNYSSGGTYSANVATPLYAQWSIIKYTITYNANGGSGAPASQTKNYGATATISSTIPTRDGYNFGGWNTKNDKSGTHYASGASYSANSNLALYAEWTKKTYSVTYSASGASNIPATQTKTYGTTLKLSTTIPTKTNYVFNNWKASNGKTYSSGGNYTDNAGTTLTAQWYNPYSVTFNANGGSGAPSNLTKVYNQNLPIPSTAPSTNKQNCIFNGWYNNTGGTGTNYAGTTYSTNANLALYAGWTQAYESPTVSISNIFRADSNGDPDDEGTYLGLECLYYVYNTGNNSFTWSVICNNVTVTTPLDGGITKTGTVKFLIAANLSTQQSYSATVTLTDDAIGAPSPHSSSSASQTKSIGTATYPIDIGMFNDGYGIALNGVATRNALDINFSDSHFGNLSTTGINLYSKTQTRNQPFIRIKPYNVNGNGLIIGDGGLTLIGGGESANNLHNEIIGSLSDGEGTERLYLCSDSNIYFNTNCNTIANRKECYIDSQGHFYDSDGDTFTPKGYGTYYKNAELTLTTSAQKIALTSFSGYGMSATSNGIKVAKAGTYLVLGSAYFHSGFTANDIVHLIILKNGTYICDSILRMYATSPYQIVQASTIVTCAANDVLYLYAYNQTAARGKIASRDGHGLSVVRLA